MDFSELYRHSNGLVAYSPDGSMIANVVGSRLVVRSSSSLSVLKTWSISTPKQVRDDGETIPERLSHAECLIHDLIWCPKSQMIALANYSSPSRRGRSDIPCTAEANLRKLSGSTPTPSNKGGWIIVRSVRSGQEDFLCELLEGIAGLSRLIWTPGADALIAWSDWHTRITIWTLDDSSPMIILAVSPSSHAICFNGNSCAILHRQTGKDFLCVYDAVTWEQQLSIDLETKDAAGVAWQPTGLYLAVWDSAIEYGLFIYTCDGTLALAMPSLSDGRGISRLTWSPSGSIAVGSYDHKIRLSDDGFLHLDHELSHRLAATDDKVSVYRDTVGSVKRPELIDSITSFVRLYSTSVGIDSTKNDVRTGHHALGVSFLSFNCDGTLLASVDDSMPGNLWIWTMAQGLPHLIVVIQHQNAIKLVQWSPNKSDTLFCSSSPSTLTLWNGTGSAPETIKIPFRDFSLNDVRWRPDGQSLILQDKDVFSCAYLDLTSNLDATTLTDDGADSTTIVK